MEAFEKVCKLEQPKTEMMVCIDMDDSDNNQQVQNLGLSGQPVPPFGQQLIP